MKTRMVHNFRTTPYISSSLNSGWIFFCFNVFLIIQNLGIPGWNTCFWDMFQYYSFYALTNQRLNCWDSPTSILMGCPKPPNSTLLTQLQPYCLASWHHNHLTGMPNCPHRQIDMSGCLISLVTNWLSCPIAMADRWEWGSVQPTHKASLLIIQVALHLLIQWGKKRKETISLNVQNALCQHYWTCETLEWL